MMSSFFQLEEFDTPKPKPAATTSNAANVPTITPADLEKEKLAGYETGYQAGWDDAARSDAGEQERISAEFARNLEDLGFTFHEARNHVMQSIEPLLLSMVEKVLPSIVSNTIGQAIIEELIPFAAEAADAPIQVVVYPQGREQLSALLNTSTTIPLEVVEESSLAEGQVYLRYGQNEKQIDLSGAIERIGDAINGLYNINEKAVQNG